MLIIDDAFIPMLAEFDGKLDTIETTLYCGMNTPPQGMDSFDALLERGKAIPENSGSYDDLMGIFYTGGSTGPAKGVMLTHTNAMTNAAIASGPESTAPPQMISPSLLTTRIDVSLSGPSGP